MFIIWEVDRYEPNHTIAICDINNQKNPPISVLTILLNIAYIIYY